MVLQTLYVIPAGTVFSADIGDDDPNLLKIRTNHPIRTTLSYSESEGGICDSVIPWAWFLTCDEGLYFSWGYGYSLEEALQDLGEDFVLSWDCYVNEDESKLSRGAIEYRDTLTEIFELVVK